MIFKSRHIRYISLGAAILFALPLPLGAFTGLYLWASPFLFVNSLLATGSVAILNLLGFFALALTVFRKRGICRYVCPAGILCDAVSKIPERRKKNFPDLGKHLIIISFFFALFGIPVFSIFDPFYIFNNFFEILSPEATVIAILKASGLVIIVLLNLIVPNVWCTKLCPLGAFQDLISETKKIFVKKKSNEKSGIRLSRRFFISGLLGIGTAILTYKILPFAKKKKLRPPGALPEKDFTSTCIRCGNCIKACPVGIIRPVSGTGGPVAFLSPEIDFTISYCLPECTLCGDVCPSGAITKFTTQKKKTLRIGIAKIELKNCLLTKNKECDRCIFYCDYDAVNIVSQGLKSHPEIIADKCVGCGACKIVCPAQVIEIVPFEKLG